jgi:hypothetical protein
MPRCRPRIASDCSSVHDPTVQEQLATTRSARQPADQRQPESVVAVLDERHDREAGRISEQHCRCVVGLAIRQPAEQLCIADLERLDVERPDTDAG